MKNFKTLTFYFTYTFIVLLMMNLTRLSATDYHVSTSGNNGNNGSATRPWRTIQYAASRVAANQGHRIIVAPGTYVENGSINIPSGTSLIGAGKGRTFVLPGAGLRRAEQPYIALGYSTIIIRGSATLRDLTLAGQDKNGASGIWVQNASNVTIKNVEVTEFFSNGICLQNAQNVTVEDVTVTDCSWASSAWVGKGFFIQDLRNSVIRRVRVVEREQRGNKGGGNAFGILPKKGSVLENVLVEDSYFQVNPTGIWNQGRAANIVVEFWGHSIIKNVVLRGNEFRNGTLSFAIKKNQQNVNASPFCFLFEQNRIVNGSQYPIELSIDNSIFQNNFIQCGSGYVFKNWEKEQERYEKLTIQNNVVEWNVGAGWPTVFIGSYGGYKDLTVRNNTLYAKGSNGFSFVDMYNPNKFGNISENFLIENNIVYRESSSITGYTYPKGFVKWLNDDYSNPHTIRNATVRGNIYWNFPAQDNGNHTGNRRENVPFTRSGAKPFPYYSQSTGKGADFNNTFAAPTPEIPTPETPEEEVPKETPPKTLAIPIRINAGGGEYKAQNGDVFLADVNYSGESKAAQIPIGITYTQDDPLYQSERYGKEFSYSFTVDNGSYDINIHLCEIYWSGDKQRIFDLEVNGKTMLEDCDIYADAGKGKAVIEKITGVEIVDGRLDLTFKTDIDNAKVSAIEILPSESKENTPPNFTLSATTVSLIENFMEPVTIQVTPDTVPIHERSQEVVYSISSSEDDIADLSIDPQTGRITITSIPGKRGIQTFEVKADDQQEENNIAIQEFKLSIGQLIDNDMPTNGGDVTLRINAGGEAYTTSDGKEFIADDPLLLQGTSRTYNTFGEVEGTEDDELYLSERWGNAFSYNVLVPNGTYKVRLHFAEIFWKGEDYRSFNVNIEDGTASIEEIDIYEKVGGFAAYILNIEHVNVSDGTINVEFSTEIDNAKLSAIEIIRTSAPDGDSDDKDFEEEMAIRINSGSTQDMMIDGKMFMADEYFTGSSNTWNNRLLKEIGETDMDDLYFTERYADRDLGKFGYNIPLDNGNYIAILHFAEIYFGVNGGYMTNSEGKRNINVALEGKEIISQLDIAKKVGSGNAYAIEVPVSIKDGSFDLVLGANVNRPKISAIEIIKPSNGGVVITEEGLNSNNFKLTADGVVINDPTAYVKVGPNPASEYAQLIMYNDFEGFFDVKIYDALGRLFSTQIIEKERVMGRYELDISRLQSGVYFISVDMDGEIQTQKLWIRH